MSIIRLFVILKFIIMKNIVKIVAITAFIMIGMSSITRASYPIKFSVNITDSCSGNWTGDYCISCYIVLGGTDYCSYYHCSLALGPNTISYDCPNLPQVSDPDYTIVVTVCRDQSPPTTCCATQRDSGLYNYQLNDGSQTIKVILH
jgi:hypothetical protein